MDGLQWKTLFKWMIWGYPYLYTLPETNGLHLKIEFAKRTFCLPTIDFQGPCQFQGGYIYIYIVGKERSLWCMLVSISFCFRIVTFVFKKGEHDISTQNNSVSSPQMVLLWNWNTMRQFDQITKNCAFSHGSKDSNHAAISSRSFS